jgi:rRNA maturation endonuclease Nob1
MAGGGAALAGATVASVAALSVPLAGLGLAGFGLYKLMKKTWEPEITCPKCRKSINDQTKFCPECGTKLA